MSTSNTSWDDTGFDSDDDSFGGGFKQTPPSTPAPVEPSTPASLEPESTPDTVKPQPTPIPPPPQYTRVEPRVVTTPQPPEKRSRWGTAFIAIAALLIVMAGGYIISTFFMRDATEEEAFYAQPEQPAKTEEERPQMQPVDTLVASSDSARRMDDNKQADNMPSIASAPVRKPSVDKDRTSTEPVPKVPAKTDPVVKDPPKNALYVVQVFSSPSRDDADEWLQILRERSVTDGFITEQKLGGEAWYRVRFGQYTTRKDAEAAAQQLGFSNPWIARVR